MFEPSPLGEFNLFTEYKKGYPRLRATSWSSSHLGLVIFSDTSFGLRPLEESVVPNIKSLDSACYSKQILDVVASNDLNAIPMPCLGPYFSGLCRRYLDLGDDVAMIAAEQLVDGMNLDQNWVTKNIASAEQDVQELARQLIHGKASRLDDLSGNTITCFVANEDEAEALRNIPGFETLEVGL